MGRQQCDGYLSTIKGLFVMTTGKTRIAGEHVKRADLKIIIRRLGGVPQTGTRNYACTVLILGELPPAILTDRVGLRSKTLVFVALRTSGGGVMG